LIWVSELVLSPSVGRLFFFWHIEVDADASAGNKLLLA